MAMAATRLGEQEVDVKQEKPDKGCMMKQRVRSGIDVMADSNDSIG